MKRTLSLILACLMAVSVTACTKGGEKTTGGGDLEFTSYPIQTEETLTYWMELPGNNVSLVTNLADTPFAKKLSEDTGVKIEYIHPAAGQTEQAFGLLLASNDLPDMIEYKWGTFSGGPSKAITEEIVKPLNDYMEHAPNLKAFLEKDASYERSARTDDGDYYMFPFVCDGDSLLITSGPVLRKDWLDELGLEVPQTYDEWTEVLTAFKEKKGATAPFAVFDALSYLVKFFGGQFSFYVDGETVKYGPAEPEFKEALTGLAEWFSKGLLDPNFVALDKKGFDANMLTGKSGAALASGGSGLGQWLAAKPDDKYDLIGAPWSLKEDGATTTLPAILPFQTKGVAITASCKNVPLAMRFLDYGYSEAGHMLYNFGIEGESYVMEDGKPMYTDVIYKNENGYTPAQAMSMYFRAASGGGASAQDERYLELYYNRPQQQESLKVWRQGLSESLEHILPTAVFPTQDESSEAAVLMTELETYVEEMAVRYITGVESLDTYENYLNRLEELKVNRAIELKQIAYDRYLKR